MGRISNGTITVLNTLTFLISVSAIGFSLWFHVKPESPCQRVLKAPLLAIGVSLLVVSVAGLVGSCCRIWLVMWLYLFVLFLLIVGLIAFTVFTIIVTNRGVGTALSRRGVGDHRIGDYSGWLHKYVVNADNWDEIKSCLVDVNLCGKIEGGKAEDFYKHKLSPILVCVCVCVFFFFFF